MHYTYVNIFRLLGGPSLGTKEISRINTPDLKVFLTPDPDPHGLQIDTGLTLRTQLMQGLFGEAKSHKFDEIISNGVREMQEWRKKEVGAGTCLIIQAEGETAVTYDSKLCNEKNGITLCADIINKKGIMDKHQSQINNIGANFIIESGGKCKISRVQFGIYLTEESGKIIHPCYFEMNSGSVLVSTKLNESTEESFSKRATWMLADNEFNNVNRLLMSSYEHQEDSQKAFTFAWNAFERLLDKVFSIKNESALKVFVEHPERFKPGDSAIPNNKATPLDKWICVSSLLELYSDEDKIIFTDGKSKRNKLFHGEDVNNLPTQNVISLVTKYMDAYYQYINK